MRLTRFTDNALRCLLLLGLEPERCIPVREIADRMNMSYASRENRPPAV
jgi:Rrf2 family nitric oxide-sensitive transcriptional repressor